MAYVTSVERIATQEGMQAGMQAGMQEGIEKGVQQGKLAGYAEIIEIQLKMRFPSVDVSQYHDALANASDIELTQIGRQLLNAKTLEDALKR
mgnify:CR=1 FL=1